MLQVILAKNICITMPYYVVMQFTAMLSIQHVVNYNSALQHHPGITTDTSDAEDEEVSLATPSAARLLLYSYVQRNTCSFLDVQDNTTQYLEKVWNDIPDRLYYGQANI
ncbi:hypothetical protein T08_412 [Trichinella sp. T8]|nr:hypothetical protein T08_412 [Trichinella sp. T8]